MSLNAELQAGLEPDTPLCPICHQPTISYMIPDYQSKQWFEEVLVWVCTDYAAHDAEPGTAALWRDWEITGDPFTLAEARALEQRIPWSEEDTDANS